ncbi:hypothetical protein LSTR_LSTR008645 [Laodelphax striatellus]|uniref:Uncharacterized protein n=1 Tax=Laodelphax striatellus TaxID=195883 RepID=A0A482WMU2_LAOST|nr:hypothetical protein LSTR_LSTR008645 [Laodelphax striatellus]
MKLPEHMRWIQPRHTDNMSFVDCNTDSDTDFNKHEVGVPGFQGSDRSTKHEQGVPGFRDSDTNFPSTKHEQGVPGFRVFGGPDVRDSSYPRESSNSPVDLMCVRGAKNEELRGFREPISRRSSETSSRKFSIDSILGRRERSSPKLGEERRREQESTASLYSTEDIIPMTSSTAGGTASYNNDAAVDYAGLSYSASLLYGGWFAAAAATKNSAQIFGLQGRRPSTPVDDVMGDDILRALKGSSGLLLPSPLLPQVCEGYSFPASRDTVNGDNFLRTSLLELPREIASRKPRSSSLFRAPHKLSASTGFNPSHVFLSSFSNVMLNIFDGT